MSCDEAALVAYLWDELDPGAAEHFERHLVDCDTCWTAVQQDARGRAAAERMREIAPPALRDHIRFAIGAENGPPVRRAGHKFGRAAAAVAMTAVAGAFIVGVSRVGRHGPSDPPAVATVVRLARAGAGAGLEVAPAFSRLTAGGQVVAVSVLPNGGTPVLVARSDRAFPTALDATPMLRDDSPWLARRGPLTLVCVNRPHPVLVAARLPADQLVAIAGQLAQEP